MIRSEGTRPSPSFAPDPEGPARPRAGSGQTPPSGLPEGAHAISSSTTVDITTSGTPGRDPRLIVDGFDFGRASDYPAGWMFWGLEAELRFGPLAGPVVFNPYGAPVGPTPTGGGTAPTPPPSKLDRLMALPGTRSYANPDAAGASAGQAAYQATFKSSSDPHSRVEHGAFIFQYQGKTFTVPLTAGESHQDGQARVDPSKMMGDLLRHIGQAGIRPSEIVVVGMVHSHPDRPGFQVPFDPDIATFEQLSKMKTWLNAGGVPMDFQRSYIWGPRSAEIGGRDPVGQLYTYPPK